MCFFTLKKHYFFLTPHHIPKSISIFEVNQWNHREVKYIVQDHTASSRRHSKNLNSGNLGLQSILLITKQKLSIK